MNTVTRPLQVGDIVEVAINGQQHFGLVEVADASAGRVQSGEWVFYQTNGVWQAYGLSFPHQVRFHARPLVLPNLPLSPQPPPLITEVQSRWARYLNDQSLSQLAPAKMSKRLARSDSFDTIIRDLDLQYRTENGVFIPPYLCGHYI